MFANLSLKSRILFSALLYIVLLSIPGFFSTAYFYLNSGKFTKTQKYPEEGLIADRFSKSQLKLQESIIGYVTTKDELFIDLYHKNSLEFNQHINLLKQQEYSSVIEASSLEQIETIGQKINDLNRYILESIQSGKTEQAFRGISADENRQLFENLTAEIEKIRAAEIEWTGKIAQEEKTAIKTLILIVGLGTLIFALFAIALSFFITDRILGTANAMISKLLNSSGAIAAEIHDHERSTHEQAQMVNRTTSPLKSLNEFCNFSTETTASVDRQLEEISTTLVWLCHQSDRLNSLSEMSDRLSDRSKKLSLNVSIKALRDEPENSRSFILLNTELRALTNDAQKLAQKLNEILLETKTIEQPIPLKTHTWGDTLSEKPTLNTSLNEIGNHGEFQPSDRLDTLLKSFEQIAWQISELALYSQQQTRSTEQLLQTTAQLEQTTGTTACGIGETNLQIQKLKQIALNLKLFLGL